MGSGDVAPETPSDTLFTHLLRPFTAGCGLFLENWRGQSVGNIMEYGFHAVVVNYTVALWCCYSGVEGVAS